MTGWGPPVEQPLWQRALASLRVWPQLKSAALAQTPLTVAVDLDGTLAENLPAFDARRIGKPRSRYRACVRLLHALGVRIIIWTVRGQKRRVARWLERHRIPYHYINFNPDQPPGSSSKLYADVYLDDRGVSATGSADAALRATLALLHARDTAKLRMALEANPAAARRLAKFLP